MMINTIKMTSNVHFSTDITNYSVKQSSENLGHILSNSQIFSVSCIKLKAVHDMCQNLITFATV